MIRVLPNFLAELIDIFLEAASCQRTIGIAAGVTELRGFQGLGSRS